MMHFEVVSNQNLLKLIVRKRDRQKGHVFSYGVQPLPIGYDVSEDHMAADGGPSDSLTICHFAFFLSLYEVFTRCHMKMM